MLIYLVIRYVMSGYAIWQDMLCQYNAKQDIQRYNMIRLTMEWYAKSIIN